MRHRERLEASSPAIYITNHTATLDVLIAMWLCRVGGCGIAKKEIARIPFFGWAYWLSGHLLIDRGDREGAIAALAATAGGISRFRRAALRRRRRLRASRSMPGSAAVGRSGRRVERRGELGFDEIRERFQPLVGEPRRLRLAALAGPHQLAR